MRARTAARLAWGLGALALAATSVELWLLMMGPKGLPLNDPDRAAAIDYLDPLLFTILGVLVAWKRPSNRVGWLLLAYVVVRAAVGVMTAYAERGVVVEPGSLPLASHAVWAATWLWTAQFVFLPLIVLNFPNGRIPSRRWRWVARFSVAPLVLMIVAALDWLDVPALYLIEAFDEGVAGAQWGMALRQVAFLVILGLMVAAVASLIVRFRRSSNVERQQLKWVMFAAALLTAHGIWSAFLPGPEDLTAAIGALAFAALPTAMGVAILRYRLYDIDRIINRTLVYGALTAMIAGAYALVALASAALGGTRIALFDNDLVVAGATLGVAAAFGPLRRRTQAFVDRRFYRSRYDAVRTVEGFSARLRDSVDLETLSADLLTTVNRTLQPAHATLWLRGSEERA
jgi:hypothetical protein